MKDPRLAKFARNLVNYSCRVQPGESVLIDISAGRSELLCELIDAVYEAGGYPFINIRDAQANRRQMMGATPEAVAVMTDFESYRMKKMQAYISVGASPNQFEAADVPPDKMAMVERDYVLPVHLKIRVAQTKWVLAAYPTPSMAQLAGMSTEAFENFYFDVCCMDYSKMDRAMDALKALMERTDKVQLLAQGTDLTFSIKGMPAVKCAGEYNIPDGEVFTAPVKDSVNGVLQYNTPSPNNGLVYENVRLVFRDGKIVEATANYTEQLNHVLDTDEGSRYIGEFAIGVNPYITRPMKDILFDEKISGSIHFTPGDAYEECPNGNRSAVHWDMVLMQTPEYGGGEIRFDGVTIRKDGRFVLPELEALNPENLMN
ncbi:MAG: aminopeptidase [Eubacteriales bacterium]|nr:aminopeptidase [Eubacteriales bacterium]